VPAPPIILGIALLFVTLALRGASANRLVRSRLTTSALLFGTYAAAAALASYGPLPPDVAQQIRSFNPLLLAFGLATIVVVLAINPWREDRLPDRFPTIVQDAIVIALFAIVATLFMQEKVLATTAVGAVVIGFALQDTLGNLFSGLAIQIEKPFRVGQWVTIAGTDGLVSEVTWRATKIRTKSGNFVVVPNSVVAKETITNYSEPTQETRLEVEVGASYDTPPNEVKSVIARALRDEPLLATTREPEILISDFASSAITYRIRVWTSDFASDMRVRDRVRSHIYYAFRRHGITIPYPIQVQIEQPASSPVNVDAGGRTALIDGVDVLSSLSEEQRIQLVDSAHAMLYEAGQVIVRQGDPGASMFIVREGEAAVTIAGAHGEVARHSAGGFFGEMSLLTGDPRTATITAVTDCELLEIGAEAFRRVVLADAAVVDKVTAAVAVRRAELEQHRAVRAVDTTAPEPSQNLVARVRRFLRL
jgi:small-conductance mechanosensitive channel/CRP-like cAMP-binding protein